MFVTLMLLAMPGIGGHNPALAHRRGRKSLSPVSLSDSSAATSYCLLRG
jgi:hypothetical protein